jgi:WhiB family redox-sensing transcriptional regulator
VTSQPNLPVQPSTSAGLPAIALESLIRRRWPLVAEQGQGWRAEANCRGVDPDLFFPERGATTGEAKAVCAACVVREDCLEYAIANGEKFGIWGGMAERQRRVLRRARRRAK